MKKLFAFLLILSLMLCAVGCQTPGNYGSEADLESNIKKAFIEQRPAAKDLTEDDLSIDSYGTYNGCTVGYIIGPFFYTQALSGEKVGPYMFEYSDSQKMLAYKDGQIKSMAEAYALSWLDKDAVKQILEKHKQEYAYLYDSNP